MKRFLNLKRKQGEITKKSIVKSKFQKNSLKRRRRKDLPRKKELLLKILIFDGSNSLSKRKVLKRKQVYEKDFSVKKCKKFYKNQGFEKLIMISLTLLYFLAITSSSRCFYSNYVILLNFETIFSSKINLALLIKKPVLPNLPFFSSFQPIWRVYSSFT